MFKRAGKVGSKNDLSRRHCVTNLNATLDPTNHHWRHYDTHTHRQSRNVYWKPSVFLQLISYTEKRLRLFLRRNVGILIAENTSILWKNITDKKHEFQVSRCLIGCWWAMTPTLITSRLLNQTNLWFKIHASCLTGARPTNESILDVYTGKMSSLVDMGAGLSESMRYSDYTFILHSAILQFGQLSRR